ncbi:NAD:arginine ADP-ribosyltransferase [Kibdelosporangium aridum]|uniref:NAD(+)--protein-arginine ADP-ribosyltransferase n=2 Tax=Kibdelosporangium aridum TaxID=2030 RepID=A0A1W2CZ37_KIBAR|nr:NAD:arginine ADP-ribosyltransferase [Kibdelosporangium aridum]
MAGQRDNVSIKDTADIIRAAGWDGKQPILLVGCQTGAKADGVASQLARELGGEVTAPTKDAWVDERGNLFASSSQHDPKRDFRPGWPPNGEWKTFKADGTSTPHTQSSPPGHTPDWRDVGDNGPSRAFRRGEHPPQFGQDPSTHRPVQADRHDWTRRAGPPPPSHLHDARPTDVLRPEYRPQGAPLAPPDAPLFFENRPDFHATQQDAVRMRQEIPRNWFEQDARRVDEALARNPHLRHIPRDELIALRGYTAHNTAVTVNKALRENDFPTLQRHEAQIRMASSALNKMPIHQGVVTRVVRTNFPEQFAARYQQGMEVTERSFTSASGPNVHRPIDGQVRMQIRSYTGRDVSALSHNPHEREVLFGPGTRFKVVGHGFHKDTNTLHLQLEEIPPPRRPAPAPNAWQQHQGQLQPPPQRSHPAPLPPPQQHRPVPSGQPGFGPNPNAAPPPPRPAPSQPTQPVPRPQYHQTQPAPNQQPAQPPAHQGPPVTTTERDWQQQQQPARDVSNWLREVADGDDVGTRQPVQEIAEREPQPRNEKPLGERLGELSDERLDRLRPDMVATKSGMAIFDTSEKNHHYTAKQIRPIPGYFVVDMHGSAHTVRSGKMNIGDADIAEILHANPDWDGKTPILLTGCGTGKELDGVAARLAQRLGIEVTAPHSDAWADYDGNLFAAQTDDTPTERGETRPKWPPNGEWTRFGPDGKPLPPDGSPYPPGHTPTWGKDVPTDAPSSAYSRSEDDSPPPRTPYTVEDVARYLDRPEVQAALNTDAQIEVKIGDDKVELPVRDVITGRLGNHPDLVQVIERTDYLERSLLHTPKTLASLLVHPDAIPHLIKAVEDVDTRGHEAINDEIAASPKAQGPEVDEVQQRASQAMADRVVPTPEKDLHQPGYKEIWHRTDDEAAVRRFLDGMYKTGRPAQQALIDIVSPIAKDLGGTAGHRNPKTLKDPERAMKKINDDYDGDPSRLVDLVGSMIVFDRLDQIYDALAVLRDKAVIKDGTGFEIVRYKDRFQKPQGSGYCDIQMNVRLPNGHIGEFRLHLAKVEVVAKWDHALYEVRRDLQSIATSEEREMSNQERALENAILLRQRALYQRALQEREGGSEE